MIMIQQQQVYPPFGQKMATAKSAEALVKAEDDTSSIESMSTTPPVSGVAVCVIKETESVLKATTIHNNNNNERCRSESPAELRATTFNGVIKTTDLIHGGAGVSGIGHVGIGIGIGGPLSPHSVVTKAAAVAINGIATPTLTTQQTINELSKYHVRRYMKRSNSFDDDDELYDAEAEDRIISKQYERRAAKQQHYDSEPEHAHGDDEPINAYTDYNGRYTTDDDEPLDLSLSSERRQRISNHNYSDTESDDSAGTGEEKTSGKAAYKKNLMKRYRK